MTKWTATKTEGGGGQCTRAVLSVPCHCTARESGADLGPKELSVTISRTDAVAG